MCDTNAKGFFIGGPDDEYTCRVSNLVAKKLLSAGLTFGYFKMELSIFKSYHTAAEIAGNDPWLLRVNVVTVRDYVMISDLGYSPELVFHVRNEYQLTGNEFHEEYNDRLVTFVGSPEHVSTLVANEILATLA